MSYDIEIVPHFPCFVNTFNNLFKVYIMIIFFIYDLSLFIKHDIFSLGVAAYYHGEFIIHKHFTVL